MCTGFVNGWRCWCYAIDGHVFYDWSALNESGACGQVEDLVRIFGYVRELGSIAAGLFGQAFGRVEKDPSANGWLVFIFSKPFIETGLVTSLRFLEECGDLVDRLFQLFREVCTVIPGRWRCVIFVMEGELRRWTIQGKI